jgi:hypothetical protein
MKSGSGMCGVTISDDARKKNDAKWVQCSYCLIPYHVLYQPTDAEEEVFMCDKCCGTETESD